MSWDWEKQSPAFKQNHRNNGKTEEIISKLKQKKREKEPECRLSKKSLPANINRQCQAAWKNHEAEISIWLWEKIW